MQGVVGLAGFEHVLDADAGLLGDLGRGGAAPVAGQLLAEPLDAEGELLRSRGMRSDQPWSRKWRLIAPAMLGTA